jgi:hypothetical protein
VNNLLLVLMPTASGKALIETQSALFYIAGKSGRPIQVGHSNKGTSVMARNYLVAKACEERNTSTIRALSIDDDIRIENPDVVIDYFRKADEGNFNLCANYHMADGKNILCHKTGATGADWHYTDQELQELDDLAIVDRCGFGFYYGELTTSYTFRTDLIPDDYNFCDEMNVRPHFAKNIKLRHLQEAWY